jgi:hypothetical protein
MSASVEKLLLRLEQAKAQYGRAEDHRLKDLLAELDKRSFGDASQLIRFHEALMFLRAFPPDPQVFDAAGRILEGFVKRVERLRTAGADLSPFDPLEVSGIAGTVMEGNLGFEEARWIATHYPGAEMVWEDYEEESAIAATWPRFMPLLDEDALVEAGTPWRRWLDAARGRKGDLEWLLQRFDSLPLSACAKAELYDSLRITVRWRMGNSRASRTRNWQVVQPVFYHTTPLLERREVSLPTELAKAGPELERVPRREGEAVIQMVREVMAVRYRELYGTTRGDPESVVRAQVGRGTVIYLWGLAPALRLPLRAYVAGFTLKNGVPINYIEAIGLCEWMEVGFNTFYTFRNGETAWVYAQVLRALRQKMGTRCVSVYPYQIGQNNEEALESGAFWFYRKLGFRPGNRELLRLAEREEQRIARDRAYRTPLRTLRRLAESHVFYELPGTAPGAWDTFSTRSIGLKVNDRMAHEFGGDASRIRRACAAKVEKALGVRLAEWGELEQRAFEDMALVLAMVHGLGRWTAQEKQDAAAVIRAKAGHDEMAYMKKAQAHTKLREALLKLGS